MGKIPRGLNEKLVKIDMWRNEIVHEDSNVLIMPGDMNLVFLGRFDLVRFLSEIANDSGVPLTAREWPSSTFLKLSCL